MVLSEGASRRRQPARTAPEVACGRAAEPYHFAAKLVLIRHCSANGERKVPQPDLAQVFRAIPQRKIIRAAPYPSALDACHNNLRCCNDTAIKFSFFRSIVGPA